MNRRNYSEPGQAMILLILAMVGLFGFTALAIDGGRTFADRRYAQNGADAASLAGAGAAAGELKLAQETPGATGVNGEDWNCVDVEPARVQAEAQAVINAFNNGFTITPSTDFYANGNIVSARCYPEGYLDVRVSITIDTQTSFAHFVYQGPVQNTVDAITRVYPRRPLAGGWAIVSLTDNCSGPEKGTRFSGTSDVLISGGGIFSNSCLVSDGSSGTVTITGGVANYDETFPYDPHGSPIITPTEVVIPVDYPFKPLLPPPTGCLGDQNPPIVNVGSVYTLSPGRYTNNVTITNSGPITPTVTLEPGLYCFDDGATFRVNGSDLSGDGVTFYFTADGGGFNTAGMGTVTLYPPHEPCLDEDGNVLPGYSSGDCSPAVPNMLIYVEAGNTNSFDLGGNSLSYYEGTIYAETAQVNVGGASSALSNVGVQVIANDVRVHGTVDMHIIYDDSLVYHLPNKINLEK